MLPSHMGELLSAERADCWFFTGDKGVFAFGTWTMLENNVRGGLQKNFCCIVNYCVQDKLFGGVTRFITEADPNNLRSTARDIA